MMKYISDVGLLYDEIYVVFCLKNKIEDEAFIQCKLSGPGHHGGSKLDSDYIYIKTIQRRCFKFTVQDLTKSFQEWVGVLDNFFHVRRTLSSARDL